MPNLNHPGKMNMASLTQLLIRNIYILYKNISTLYVRKVSLLPVTYFSSACYILFNEASIPFLLYE